mgnify:CR=1 FL=1
MPYSVPYCEIDMSERADLIISQMRRQSAENNMKAATKNMKTSVKTLKKTLVDDVIDNVTRSRRALNEVVHQNQKVAERLDRNLQPRLDIDARR